jgi:Na+/H+-dicarboxylate symporter/ABC-type amino acid transport substrate-binding protein
MAPSDAKKPIEDQRSGETADRRLLQGTLVALLAGVACGLFWGELCAPLMRIGDIFIGLLQMTVLPYIVCSLIGSIGRLSFRQSRHTVLYGAAFLALLWLLGLLGIVLLPQALPEWKSSSFFSSSLVESPEAVDLFHLFIPDNIFRALSNGLVPAIVVFSIAVGVAVMRMEGEGKVQLLRLLKTLTKTLAGVNLFVLRFMPLGVFAIVAATAGTMHPDQLGRVQAYLVLQTEIVLLLAFLILPGLVACVTDFSYREVLRRSRTAMIAAFATGKVLVVLPLLIQTAEEMFQVQRRGEDSRAPSIDALIPLAYPFPHLGKLSSLIFVPFAAWYAGSPMALHQYPAFLTSGLVSYFGSPLVAVPFLLNLEHIPADTFQLFVAGGVYSTRLGDLLGAMHLLVLTLLTISAAQGTFRVKPLRLVTLIVVSLGLTLAVMQGTHLYLSRAVTGTYNKDQVVANMQLLLHPSPAVVHRSVPARRQPPEPRAKGLDSIRDSGKLRVGYRPEHLPFSFFNAADQLVGFDVDLAHLLARELNVELEFVPFQWNRLADQLNQDDFDVAMSGVPMTTTNLERMSFSSSYLDLTLALVVPDWRRREFGRLESVQGMDELTLAVSESKSLYLRGALADVLPQARVVEIRSTGEVLQQKDPQVDAVLTTAEAGSVWTLLYPEFTVVVPQPDVVRIPVGYATARGNSDLVDFLSRWIELKSKGGEIELLYEHWILGKTAEERKRRWSIAHDVLHWVD